MPKNKKIDYNKVEAVDNMKVSKGGEEPLESERKSLDAIVSEEPTKVKKSLVGRLISGVVGPDGLSGIGQYVSEEIIIPAIKNIIVDSVTSGINQMMYGDSRGSAPRDLGGPPRNIGYGSPHRPRFNYSSRFTSQHPEPAQQAPSRGVRQVVEDYIIKNREDAAHVLTSLTEHADMYGSVSVADYYDLIGIQSSYTDENYGWIFETMAHASIRPVRGGYVIKFPPVEVI